MFLHDMTPSWAVENHQHFYLHWSTLIIFTAYNYNASFLLFFITLTSTFVIFQDKPLTYALVKHIYYWSLNNMLFLYKIFHLSSRKDWSLICLNNSLPGTDMYRRCILVCQRNHQLAWVINHLKRAALISKKFMQPTQHIHTNASTEPTTSTTNRKAHFLPNHKTESNPRSLGGISPDPLSPFGCCTSISVCCADRKRKPTFFLQPAVVTSRNLWTQIQSN